MQPLKRKDSCTFKREKPLEVQERIYPLLTEEGSSQTPLLVQEGMKGWSVVATVNSSFELTVGS
jgi:hypothetical protein